MTQPLDDTTKRQFTMGPCLGKGGFGEVYRARMSSAAGLESEVAVKVLRNDLDPAGQAVQRLRDEGRLLARLNHPTILRVHDLVLLEGCISLVTEYIEGEDLGACLCGPDPMTIRAQLEVIAGVAAALNVAWTAPGNDGKPLELVHRDIKPSNIRISRHGQVKLLDFGIARSDSMQREARTATNLMVGSPGYMAPERFLDAASIPASDVFALGCCLYEGLAGGERLFQDVPFPVMTGMAVHQQRFDKFVAKQWAKLPSGVPEPVLELLRSLIAYEPAERPTAFDLAHRCEELADTVPGASLSRWAKARKWPDPSLEVGPFANRTITEGTMTRTTLEAPRPPQAPEMTRWEANPISGSGSRAVRQPTASSSDSAARPAPRMGLAVAGGVVVLGVGAVLLVLGVVGGVAATSFMGGDVASTAAPVTAEAEPPAEAAPEPVVEDPPAEEAAVEPLVEDPAVEDPPVEAAIVAAPAGSTARSPRKTTPTPAVATAPKAAEPAPSASTGAKALVEVQTGGGPFVVELLRGGNRYPLPARVEAGPYEVVYAFEGGAAVSLGTLQLGEGDTRVVKCSPGFRKCTRP